MIRAGIDNRWIRFRCSKFHGAEHDLDSLVDHLYDDMESKVEASLTMFWMSLDIERLGAMASHESALGAFARVLREEGRKNFHLRSNAVSTFWIFSHFHNFHQLLIENQIGRATLILLDLESMRMQKQPAVTDLKALGSNVAKGEKILSLGLNENEPALEEQERFLYMSISLLYHIAEDPQIERRMCKYNLVEHLCEVLNRANACLLTIAMAFLKRLSLYIENLNPMRENGIMLKLSNFLHTENESLLSDTLQILHNLSFDRRFREDMVDSGFLQSFRSLLQKRKFEDMVTNILYNLSRDFDLRLRFAESELLSIVMEPLITENNMSVSEELGALIINLTYNPKVAMVPLSLHKIKSESPGDGKVCLFCFGKQQFASL